MLFVDNAVNNAAKMLAVESTEGIIKLAPEDASHHQLSIKCGVSFIKGILTCPVHVFQRMVIGGGRAAEIV